ncbi:MAG: response regulator [Candidatus Eisenbacteria sp.]|nr:response regulator [Candidatus Eisenbacteria bacterium]
MEPRRILIVDDDSTVARILVRVFERAGFSATAARNGKQALALLSNEHFDAMICDIQMPEMDGRELCQELSSSGPYFPGCTFIVTSRSEEEERSWVAEHPNVGLVEKPVSPKQIMRLVSQELGVEIDGHPSDRDQRAA